MFLQLALTSGKCGKKKADNFRNRVRTHYSKQVKTGFEPSSGTCHYLLCSVILCHADLFWRIIQWLKMFDKNCLRYRIL